MRRVQSSSGYVADQQCSTQPAPYGWCRTTPGAAYYGHAQPGMSSYSAGGPPHSGYYGPPPAPPTLPPGAGYSGRYVVNDRVMAQSAAGFAQPPPFNAAARNIPVIMPPQH